MIDIGGKAILLAGKRWSIHFVQAIEGNVFD